MALTLCMKVQAAVGAPIIPALNAVVGTILMSSLGQPNTSKGILHGY